MKKNAKVRKMLDGYSHGPYTVHEYNKHNSKSMSLQTNQNQNQMSESSSINHNEKMKIFEVVFLKN